MELVEGTGGITDMCPCGEFLEIYKEDVTFRLHTPETIDPDRTNPNAPVAAMVADTVGSAHPVVARVLLQGRDLIESGAFTSPVDKDAVVIRLHEIKEHLVVCSKAAEILCSRLDEINAKVQTDGVRVGGGGCMLPSVPQVPDLESVVTQFLIAAKRSVKAMCSLPSFFIFLDGSDNNFDHLGARLARHLGEDAPLSVFVRENAGAPRYLIELRNGQEHPKAGSRLQVENIRVLPDGSLRAPAWFQTGGDPRPIRVEMASAVDVLTEIAEWLFLHLISHALDPKWPFVIQELQGNEIDPKKPIRYRLGVNLGGPEGASNARKAGP